MRTGTIIGVLAAIVLVVFAVYMIDFDVTEEATLPNVDVTVEGGNLPEVEAEVGDVEVGNEEVTVTVPTVEVNPPEDDSVARN